MCCVQRDNFGVCVYLDLQNFDFKWLLVSSKTIKFCISMILFLLFWYPMVKFLFVILRNGLFCYFVNKVFFLLFCQQSVCFVTPRNGLFCYLVNKLFILLLPETVCFVTPRNGLFCYSQKRFVLLFWQETVCFVFFAKKLFVLPAWETFVFVCERIWDKPSQAVRPEVLLITRENRCRDTPDLVWKGVKTHLLKPFMQN